MNNLNKFFESICKDRAKITGSPDGKIFEENFKSYLKRSGFNEMSLTIIDDGLKRFLKEIKPKILSKNDTQILKNSIYLNNTNRKDYANFFIWQPYGSQNFPDFLVFCQNYIFAIETKFSSKTSNKPMWNSNIPKENSIYVFASYQQRDLTFFLGHDVIEKKEREELLILWQKTDEEYNKWTKSFRDKINAGKFSNEYGFTTYIRKAYEQKNTHNKNAILNFFKNKNRKKLEDNVFEFINKHK
ncbi:MULTISPECIES: hypothetical protein [Campylobacter]|uniref:Restriction endonuclease n=1 Tax=Campylobacter porcelli TaxID=1660073 RepID=A0ABU7M5M4_9BACT|nr:MULTISPECIES: hypothetical protein [unclassified Campylobacter]MCR8679639.1 type II restriction endonuclease [Campylobacter sp. RM19072]MCR8696816.1 type II restriction endonuclease [Campylobacter sp. RM19073]MEE3704613.1 hypothetical protein [Campylobacter sp. CX2-8023-23]MEE3745015.1 hypothetical protein [Campylobacter sp. CX2-4855-23]